MDGVQWRHCLSDAAIILFPLGGKERDTLWIRQRRLSNITEHHQRHVGGDPLLALRLLNVATFGLCRLNRIPHFMCSSKNVFAAERQDSRSHEAATVILSAGRMCQAIILILGCLLSVGLSCVCEPKNVLRELKKLIL